MKLFFKSLANLAAFAKKNNELNKISTLLAKDFGLSPCFGVELEFYLKGKVDLTAFKRYLGLKIKSEKGAGQFEIDLPPSRAPENYAEQINFYQRKIIKDAKLAGGNANLLAKPYVNDYGNSLHFHLNFIERHDQQFTEILANILCNFMLETFLVFMPEENDYARLDHNFMAPTCVCFGGNNRSVAVRIPSSLPRRVEHRVSSPQADPYLVMLTMLKSVYLGLKYPKQMLKYTKIYGNAFDSQYSQQLFPESKTEAEKLFNWQLFRGLNNMY